MVASTDIKFYVHTNSNAPQLQNAFGSMISVLDACLVNGINIGPISSLTASGTTITALFSSAHNLMQYQVIKITGAAQSEFNGEHRILTVPNAQSVTFELAFVPSVSQATGTVSASLPPLGWEKPFSSSNPSGGGKAAYRSKNLLLPSRPFLRVVDELDPAYTVTYAKYAKVGLVEDLTDINTMLGVQAPFDSSNPGRNWIASGSDSNVVNGWSKWYYALEGSFYSSTSESGIPTSGSRSWVVVGDSDYFYIFPTTMAGDSFAATYGFGVFDSLLNIDTANSFLSSSLIELGVTAADRQPKTRYTGLGSTSVQGATLLQRRYDNQPNHTLAKTLSLGVSSSIESGRFNYINDTSLTNVVPFAPVFLFDDVLRGILKGFYWLFQDKPYLNLEAIEKNKELFVAINVAVGVGVAGYKGQIIVKVGGI